MLGTLETALEEARDIERDYNELVYDLYDLNEDTKDLIRDRVVHPENPLEPREMD